MLRTITAVATLVGALWAATPGTFRGIVVHAPRESKWVYVRSAGGVTRRVDLSQAKIVSHESVPTAVQTKHPLLSVSEGTEVRVTAVQDRDGEWRATEVEVLKAPPR